MLAQNMGVNSVNFYNNFISLCNQVGKTPSRVAMEIGLSKPTVNRWKNGSSPTDATAMKIAEYFGVSIQDLIGKASIDDLAYEVCRDLGLVESPFKNEKKPSADNSEELLNNEIIERLISLTPAELEKVDAFVQGLLASR